MPGDKVYLVGPMGAGKSTVARLLAPRLQAGVVDLDAEIEDAFGRSIPELFAEHGESGFRDREERVLAEVAQRPGPLVVATGGGVILRDANRRVMAASGTMVYLHADVDTLLARTAGSANRPLLQVADPRAKLAALQAERDPLYREAAILVEGAESSPAEVAEEILHRLADAGDTPVE
ncbi:shikimate kinase [Thiohalorhabdus methylotrophus]|uniref:Shikimate kinase n=1 Tax=Thiohalorhabdus methylotrophus TaxID=3242694 RepID=A0ABV4TRW4_9GAMM